MLYVTQLTHEPGTDMGWSTWLVLEHAQETSRHPLNPTPGFVSLDDVLGQVDLNWPDFDDEYDGDAKLPSEVWEAWVASVKAALEARGFKIVGQAEYVFNSMQR